MGYPCVRPYILFYIHGPAIFLFFELREYHIITEIVCYQKLIKSLPDIVEHICQIHRISDGTFFLKQANEHFFISGRSN